MTRFIGRYIYDEEEIDEMLLLIRDSFIPAFSVLEELLWKKQEEVFLPDFGGYV